MPILTPSSLLYLQPNALPELEPHNIQEYDLRKRAKYLQRCKDALWLRWTTEYLRGLRERHRLKHKGKPNHPVKGDVVIIKSEEKNRNEWKLGIVEDLITGRDGVVRGAKLRAGKYNMERAVKHPSPLELTCNSVNDTPTAPLNPHPTNIFYVRMIPSGVQSDPIPKCAKITLEYHFYSSFRCLKMFYCSFNKQLTILVN